MFFTIWKVSTSILSLVPMQKDQTTNILKDIYVQEWKKIVIAVISTEKIQQDWKVFTNTIVNYYLQDIDDYFNYNYWEIKATNISSEESSWQMVLQLNHTKIVTLKLIRIPN